MARIRSVHPGLFTDDAFMMLRDSAPVACLLMIGLWGEADDQGVFPWKPSTLHARILPNAVADVADLLARLLETGFVVCFTADGKSFGAIHNFRRYQRPEKPRAVYPLPADLRYFVGLDDEPPAAAPERLNGSGREPPLESASVLRPVGDQSATSRGGVGVGEKEEKKEEEKEDSGANAPGASAAPGPRRAGTLGTRAAAPPLPASGPPPDPREPTVRIWRDGPAMLAHLTGQSEASARKGIAKLRQVAREDCAAVLGALEAAEGRQLSDPMAWLMRAVQVRSGQRLPGANAPPAAPVYRNGFAAIMARARAKEAAQAELAVLGLDGRA